VSTAIRTSAGCAGFGATDRTAIPLRIVGNPFQNKFLECHHRGGYSVTMKHVDFTHTPASFPTGSTLVQAATECALMAWAIRLPRAVLNDCDSLGI
jgi:hypothetical protein